MIADVLIEDGAIAGVGANVAADGAREIDARRPDRRARLRRPPHAPARPRPRVQGDIETGTRAAARGGFTTVCAMPNTEPAMDTRSVVEYVLREAAATRQRPRAADRRRDQRPRRQRTRRARRSGRRRAASRFSDDGAPVCGRDAHAPRARVREHVRPADHRPLRGPVARAGRRHARGLGIDAPRPARRPRGLRRGRWSRATSRWPRRRARTSTSRTSARRRASS